MPTTVSSSSGVSYHLFQLPDLCAPNPEDGVTFTTIDNQLSQGFRSSSLLGLNTGVKFWGLTFPTISAYGPTVTDPYSATVTREQYLRNLFKYNRTTGTPFAIQWPATTGQYYLVDFADDTLSMAKTKGVNIYNTTIKLKQRRIDGETVFSLYAYGTARGYSELYNDGGHFDPNWENEINGANELTAPAGGVTWSSNAQNGHNTVRLNGSSGYLSASGDILSQNSVTDIFIVMQMREATFSGADVLFSDSGVANRILGTNAGTKWADPSLSGFRYWLNGTEYATSNMQAPMNAFGICHFRATEAAPISFSASASIGRSSAGSAYLTADIGEIFASSDSLPLKDVREITEHLATKWGITI